ncbi:MAG TPA: response regulator [Minicystis sp.]|nr:response regulator [Minicystis sp.]
MDDDARTARTLAKMLREDGFQIDVATDGAVAIGRLARGPLPHVLVTELVMPRVDGGTVARFARSRRADLPVVLITEVVDCQLERELDPHLWVFTKPVEYEALRSALDGFCGVHHSVAPGP